MLYRIGTLVLAILSGCTEPALVSDPRAVEAQSGCHVHSQQVFNEIADGHYLHSPAMDSGGGTYFDFRWRGDPAFLFRLEIQMEWDPHDPTSETLQLVASVDADRSRFDQPEVNGSSPLVLRLDPMPSSIIEKPRIYFGSVPDYSAPVSLTFVALEQPVRVTLMETYRC